MYRKYVPFLLFLFFLYGCNGNKQEEKEDVSVFRGFTATESGRRDHGGDFIQFYLLLPI